MALHERGLTVLVLLSYFSYDYEDELLTVIDDDEDDVPLAEYCHMVQTTPCWMALNDGMEP